MKTLMKQIGRNGRGQKKARFWNVAHLQPRRWHREQQQSAPTNSAPAPNEPNPRALVTPTKPQPPASLHDSPASTPQADTVPSEAVIARDCSESASAKIVNSFVASSNPPIVASSHPPTLPVNLPNPPRPKDAPAPTPQHEDKEEEKKETKERFIVLRANGWSFRSISSKLGVPKSTLFNWEADTATKRAIHVIKSIHIERLQEQYLPSFEEELQKLSTCLVRIEHALEKHDFDSMRPEFLLRTSLQLRARLQKLRIHADPSDTLDHGPSPAMNCGCISRSEEVCPEPESLANDTAPKSDTASESSEDRNVSPSALAEIWDTHKKSEPSQPSSPMTSVGEVGTTVPLSEPTDAPNIVSSLPGRAEASVNTAIRNDEFSLAASFPGSKCTAAPPPYTSPMTSQVSTTAAVALPGRSGNCALKFEGLSSNY